MSSALGLESRFPDSYIDLMQLSSRRRCRNSQWMGEDPVSDLTVKTSKDALRTSEAQKTRREDRALKLQQTFSSVFTRIGDIGCRLWCFCFRQYLQCRAMMLSASS